jgi:hypothetical protein
MYVGLFPRNIRAGAIDETVGNFMRLGEVRTVYYPNSYLVPPNVEISLLSDYHVIVTAFLVAFGGLESTTAVICCLLCLSS